MTGTFSKGATLVSLIILSGRPGAGKSTLARTLARRIGATSIRVDTIEQTMRDAGIELVVGDEGYRIACAVAGENLRLGRRVIADSVNPIAETRRAWHAVAEHAAVAYLDIEVVCSDAMEHRRRVETRVSDIAGLRMPTWDEVVAREYHPWSGNRLVVDTSEAGIDECVEEILRVARGDG